MPWESPLWTEYIDETGDDAALHSEHDASHLLDINDLSLSTQTRPLRTGQRMTISNDAVKKPAAMAPPAGSSDTSSTQHRPRSYGENQGMGSSRRLTKIERATAATTCDPSTIRVCR